MRADSDTIQVQLKLFASYRRYLPSNCTGNSCHLVMTPGSTVEDLLRKYDIPLDEHLVILRNGRSVEREAALQDQDVIAVFPAMAGG
jgi:molybdopterin converting factor small subunit